MYIPDDAIERLWHVCLPYITSIKTMIAHKHYCYKVAVSLDHKIECRVDDSDYEAMRGFIMNSNASHKCISPDGPVLSILIEPQSPWGNKIREILNGRVFVRFEEIMDVGKLGHILPVDHAELGDIDLIPHIFQLMYTITGLEIEASGMLDPRVSRIIDYVGQNLKSDITNEDILNLTHLSFHRTRHLFASETGIPLSRYILWQRLRGTLKTVLETGESLSRVAAEYQFTDLSHFHKAFKNIFGLNPSTFLTECRVVVEDDRDVEESVLNSGDL
ncbi:AraC family transcriptional regulator [Dyadobacter beijingensis]|uniref:AraC family transcriptional regulator n=1 Tax=Dyadobacter beijingensis TaxID=365489 RepID=A0ABQ2I3I4_9BACT|nr:helix-turn-helix transcriptional regulator [Dyadobacter beijingensis]GGM96595.1 AraC family transcriptional regulator [Dyadobacter beijingensis]